jgi:hypothetical protein
VNELTSRIEREQRAVNALQSELRTLAANVGREQRGLDTIRGDLDATERRVEREQERLHALRAQLAVRARTLYMHGGPIDMIGVVLGARTFSEFIGRTTYTSRIARRDEQLVLDARASEAKLRALRDVQRRLERDQSNKVGALRSREDRLTDAFARQQAALADLAKARKEALALVAQLGAAAGGLRRVAGQGMTISYGEWAESLLPALGAGAGKENLIAIVAWEASEGTQATWNPLATTKDMPGSTQYNGAGVRNYLSLEQGIDATTGTIELPNRGYEPIIARLKDGGDAMKTAEAIRDSMWCRGCAGGTYVTGFIEAVRRYYDRYAN